MRYKLIRRSVILGILTAVFTVVFPSVSQADPLVLRGFDLFTTDRGGTRIDLRGITRFSGIQPFIGVPLGSLNLGTGQVDTLGADMIVQRLGDASPGSPTIPVQVVALQLVSLDPFNLGAGTDFHFLTLQSARGGPASTGSMTITFGPEGSPHGTFDSTLNYFFDIRVGSLTGPIVFSGMTTLIATGVPWSHFPPPNAVLIPGVNFSLNGQNQLNDFFALGLVRSVHPDPFSGSMHSFNTAVPEPGTIGLLTAGIAGLVARVYKRRKRGLSEE